MSKVWTKILASLFLTIVIVFCFFNLSKTQASNTNNEVEYKANQIVVKFKKGLGGAGDLAGTYGITLKKISAGGYAILQVPKGHSVDELLSLLSKDKNVKYAHKDYKGRLAFTPNDPYYPLQWNFNASHINMPKAWNTTRGKSNVRVAVVDTGVAYENYQNFGQAPDLAQTKFIYPYNNAIDDFGTISYHANDDYGHGTHVTGTIAQSTNNGIGVAGIAPNITIIPVDVFYPSGTTYSSNVADGIYWAINHGAKVITMSLEFQYPVPVVEEAIETAVNHGILVTVAVGNGKRPWPFGDGIDGTGDASLAYPAAYTQSFAVGATDYADARTYYSNYGDGLDIMAPGGDTYADLNHDGYLDGILQQTYTDPSVSFKDFSLQLYQGTSMATPHVAGAAALLFSQGKSFSQVKKSLRRTAYKGMTNYSKFEYGAGRLDVAKAVNYTFCSKSTLRKYQKQLSNYTVLKKKYRKLYQKYPVNSMNYKKYLALFNKYKKLKKAQIKKVSSCKSHM